MSVATLLKRTADTFMAARLAKRVAEDVVRQVPYPSIGAAALIGAAVGFALARPRGGIRRSATRKLQGRLPKTGE